ncbi:hypothetical protein [Actinoplanes sp. NPDC048796]|uniref:hypothetical protein n=1 Tax=Actinoplanes sp. NPDC048796 TaxID=3155640 RepID=UPI0033D60098
MKHSLRRYTAGALAVGAFTLGTSAPALAADDDPDFGKAVPTVTTATFNKLVAYGSSATVSFSVKADNVRLARRSVQLCTAALTEDFACVDTKTSASGTVSVKTPKLAAPLLVQVVVPEDDEVEAFTSDTVVVRPQVGIKLARKNDTLNVTLTGLDSQVLVLKRQEKGKWLLAAVTRATGATTTLSGLAKGQKYQVTVSDTATIKGAVKSA